MPESYGVLARAVARLRPRQQENEATEALAYLLSSSAEAAVALVELLQTCAPTVPEAPRFRTQTRDALTGAQTDLEVLDGSGVARVVIEVKLGAGLHGDQLRQYVQQLPEDGGALVLLVPASRQDLVWSAVRHEFPDAVAVDTTTRRLDLGVHRIALTTWTRLLQAVENRLDDTDVARRADVQQIRGLVQYAEAEGFRPLLDSELTEDTFARRWQDYCRILDLTVARLLASEQLSFRSSSSNRRLRVMGGNGWYFGWFHSKGVWGRLALDAETWLAHGRAPYFLWFEKQPGQAPAFAALAGRAEEEPPKALLRADGALMVPLVPRTGVDEDDVVADLARQVEQLMVLVNAEAGPAPGQDVPPPDAEEPEPPAATT